MKYRIIKPKKNWKKLKKKLKKKKKKKKRWHKAIMIVIDYNNEIIKKI